LGFGIGLSCRALRGIANSLKKEQMVVVLGCQDVRRSYTVCLGLVPLWFRAKALNRSEPPAMPKLTKRAIDDLVSRPGSSETYAWDSELKGFGVRLMPTGVASYFIKYRNAEGRQRKLTLARVGTLTPDEARARAKRKFGEIANGADPSAERHTMRKAITISELCDLYLADAAPRIKPSTLAMDASRIETHVKPLIGRHAVVALTSEDVARMQADIAAGRSAKPRSGRGGVARGGKGVAARTVGMLGTILELARRRKIIRDNPVRDVSRLPEGKQRRFLSLDEIRLLGEVMRAAKGEPQTGVAGIKLLLLTGCRRMEVLSLPWAWIDFNASCIRFGDTKVGAQIRPIGQAAVDLLATIRRREGSPYVLPAERGDGHFIGLPRVLGRLCKTAELNDITVHVLRHTFAAVAAEMGFSELSIAGMLGHNVPGVTARYAHMPDRALVAAANEVSRRIAELMEGATQERQVIPLRQVQRA
jgi:integrase